MGLGISQFENIAEGKSLEYNNFEKTLECNSVKKTFTVGDKVIKLKQELTKINELKL